MSGVMLILNGWRSRNAGIRLVDEEREMKAVQACIDVLKAHEARLVCYRYSANSTLLKPKDL